MIKNPKTLCVYPKCKEIAIYGITTARHCVLHNFPEELALVGGACIECQLVDVLDGKGRCGSCDPDQFRRVRLAKQREVKAYLDRNPGTKDYDLYDEKVGTGECGKERPDFAWDCGTHWLVLEVDEDQHEDRKEWCECTRMVNIAGSFGMPTVYLRYNPDSYKPLKGRAQAPFLKRVDELVRWITYLKQTPPTAFVSVLKLYFDGWSGHAEVAMVVPFENK